jgi:hypothetical protein
VLRKIFDAKRVAVTSDWRKLHNSELYVLYSTPNAIRLIKMRVRWARHVARMGAEEKCIEFWWRNLKEGIHLEDLGLDSKILLKCILCSLGGH